MKIIELHPDSAVTIFSSIKIEREHPTRALTTVDLENYISQAAWKFFDKCRGEAAKRLGVKEMDLVLGDVRITNVKIDGHQVINPTGFTGQELNIGLSLTATRAGVPVGDGYPIEGSSTRAYMLSRLLGLGRAFFIESGEKMTNVFSINGGDVHHFDSFSWGAKNILEALNQDLLDLEEDVLRGLYHKYAEGNTSERLCRKMDKSFYQSFTPFVDDALTNIKNAVNIHTRVVPQIYFNPRFPIPSGVYRKHFPFGKLKLKFLKTNEALDVDTFINENIHGVYEELNELAARRIRWLIPAR